MAHTSNPSTRRQRQIITVSFREFQGEEKKKSPKVNKQRHLKKMCDWVCFLNEISFYKSGRWKAVVQTWLWTFCLKQLETTYKKSNFFPYLALVNSCMVAVEWRLPLFISMMTTAVFASLQLLP